MKQTILSQNIRTIRKSYGLSQEEFAKKIRASRAAVGSYEEARAIPTLKTLIKISSTFGISLDELVINKVQSMLTFDSRASELIASDAKKLKIK